MTQSMPGKVALPPATFLTADTWTVFPQPREEPAREPPDFRGLQRPAPPVRGVVCPPPRPLPSGLGLHPPRRPPGLRSASHLRQVPVDCVSAVTASSRQE